MKVGNLTLPLWYNYGGIIQAYSLQRALKSLGHETVLLDYHHPIPSPIRLIRNRIARATKHILRKSKNATVYPDYHQRIVISKHTREFIGKEIDVTSKMLFSSEDLKKAGNDLDVFVVGSDQIWRPSYTPNIRNYFLEFTDKPKIAYGGSFGTDAWQFSEKQLTACKPLANKFKAVSVREKSAISICKSKFGVNAIQVLDPAMLLAKDDYVSLCKKYPKPAFEGNLFSYILDDSPKNREITRAVSRELGLIPFGVMPKPFDDQFCKDEEAYIFPPLTQWLMAFNRADFIVADSFHGCVFAIIFNKPFLAIGNRERGLARFSSLLEMFNLSSRLIFSLDDLSGGLVSEEIDWQSVNEILAKNKTLSLEFLEVNLG